MSDKHREDANMTETQQWQRCFLSWIRTGEGAIPKGMSRARIQVYRNLVLNGYTSFFSNLFPAAAFLVGQEAMQTLIAQFFSRYRTRETLFHELGRDVVAFAHEIDPIGKFSSAGWRSAVSVMEFEWLLFWTRKAKDIERRDFIGLSDDACHFAEHLAVYRFACRVVQLRELALKARDENNRRHPDIIKMMKRQDVQHVAIWRQESEEPRFRTLTPAMAFSVHKLLDGGGISAASVVKELAERSGQPYEHVLQHVRQGLTNFKNAGAWAAHQEES